jgi:hypothetical protein
MGCLLHCHWSRGSCQAAVEWSTGKVHEWPWIVGSLVLAVISGKALSDVY